MEVDVNFTVHVQHDMCMRFVYCSVNRCWYLFYLQSREIAGPNSGSVFLPGEFSLRTSWHLKLISEVDLLFFH